MPMRAVSTIRPVVVGTGNPSTLPPDEVSVTFTPVSNINSYAATSVPEQLQKGNMPGTVNQVSDYVFLKLKRVRIHGNFPLLLEHFLSCFRRKKMS